MKNKQGQGGRSAARKPPETPLMRQYFDIKAKHPDAILLFRVGDFYEMYGEDAVRGAEILGIARTRRSNGSVPAVEMAGFPYHALNTYLPKLVGAGKRVAVCDQLEDPKTTKKLVKRGITELVTPGLSTVEQTMSQKENNFLATVHFDKDACGVAFLDISTGEFLASEGAADVVDKLLNNFSPKELLIKRGCRKRFEDTFGSRFYIYEVDDWAFTPQSAKERLLKHFGTRTLKGFGVEHLPLGIVAAGASLHYLDMTNHDRIAHIASLSRIEEERYVRLDRFTVRSLELTEAMNEGGTSLLNVIDQTLSPMGARMLRRWTLFPLKDLQPLQERQDMTQYFLQHPNAGKTIDAALSRMGDLERIISKVATGRISPREVVQLKNALQAIEPVKTVCADSNIPPLQRIGEQLNPCNVICERIARELTPEPPALLNKGGVIAKGVNNELDELRHIAFSGKDFLLNIQQREAERTGIPSLKVAFNNVFGYYIEVRNTHKHKVPHEWQRKQTLVNAERYITDELKDYETKILGAEEKILQLEAQLFNNLAICLMEYITPIQTNANLMAQLDCLISFAKTAIANKYVRPLLDQSDSIDIKAGRHPVIEKQLPPAESYVANDVLLEPQSQQILIITGPNMSGKSALIRQTALITLLAQIGSFVPANAARIGLVDKIFTRVGASDNISQGESTFMLEMNEAANILNNLSPHSLVLFDELGRGTSTYDGISIAWAIVEYLHERTPARPKTLFATHYHELNEMQRSLQRIRNFHIAVKEAGNKVIFLRKLLPGGSEHSFGIHVAQIAGMPKSIVQRAERILQQLEQTNNAKPLQQLAPAAEGYQLNFFQLDDPTLSLIRDEILHTNLDNLTPLEALNKLHRLRQLLHHP